MSKLLENVFKNRYTGKLFENVASYDIVELPVQAEPTGWEHRQDDKKTYLFRSYTINDFKILKYFVGEVLILGNKFNHHPRITIFDEQVDIELFTRDLNDISHTDTQMSKEISYIINDLNLLTGNV